MAPSVGGPGWPAPEAPVPFWETEGFLIGVNLPWLDYGLDFGANAWQPEGGIARPERRQRLDEVFSALGERGIRAVRWFVLGDGRAGLRLAEDGSPAGLDDRFFADLDVGLALARKHRLRLLLTLIDFLWFRPPRFLRGVQMHGRRELLRDPGQRGRLLERVFAPLFERYGGEDAILAWDVINEPEWATFGLGTWDPRRSISRRRMRACIRALVDLAHRHARQPVTVGSASAAWLGLVGGLGLDFYQAHWYDALEARAPLDRPVRSLALDRPLLLGEYPTKGSRRSAASILEAALRGGYAGALAWSVLAQDPASDRRVSETGHLSLPTA